MANLTLNVDTLARSEVGMFANFRVSTFEGLSAGFDAMAPGLDAATAIQQIGHEATDLAAAFLCQVEYFLELRLSDVAGIQGNIRLGAQF